MLIPFKPVEKFPGEPDETFDYRNEAAVEVDTSGIGLEDSRPIVVIAPAGEIIERQLVYPPRQMIGVVWNGMDLKMFTQMFPSEAKESRHLRFERLSQVDISLSLFDKTTIPYSALKAGVAGECGRIAQLQFSDQTQAPEL